MGHHQAYQHMHNGRARRRGDKERIERISEEIIAEKCSNLMKSINLHIQGQRISSSVS